MSAPPHRGEAGGRNRFRVRALDAAQSAGTGAALRYLLAAAAVVVVVAGLRAGRPVLVPLALAVFMVTASLPALEGLRRRGVPRAPAVAGIILLDTLVLGLVGWILLRSAEAVRAALPEYLARLDETEQVLARVLVGWGLEPTIPSLGALASAERVVDVAARVAVSVTGLLSASVLVLLFLVFLLLEAGGVGAKLRLAFGARMFDRSPAARIVHEVQQYLLIKTVISLATGALLGAAAWLLGVDFALLWGLLAFLLNYIPNIGSIVAAVPAVALALLQLGPGPALLLLGAYLAVNMVLGNMIEPAVMGRRLRLSTSVVLLALVFWGWVWGPVGMLLALPLTMAFKIAMENTRRYRWIAVLIAPNPDG